MLNACTGGCGTFVVAPTAVCSDCRSGKKYYPRREERSTVGNRKPRWITLPLSPTAKGEVDHVR